jgi:hypothetical protein
MEPGTRVVFNHKTTPYCVEGATGTVVACPECNESPPTPDCSTCSYFGTLPNFVVFVEWDKPLRRTSVGDGCWSYALRQLNTLELMAEAVE